MRGATPQIQALPTGRAFLSTLPVRGATPRDNDTDISCNISIHAPREGSDDTAQKELKKLEDISIHAPREGSDPELLAGADQGQISIHAPREGSDSSSSICQLSGADFYPRSP